MRFLVDAQLPPELARWLEAQGHIAAHVFELGLVDADDAVIWTKAFFMGAIIVTKDEDFIAMRHHAANGPAVVWLRSGNATNRSLIEWLSKIFPAAIAALEKGEQVVELK